MAHRKRSGLATSRIGFFADRFVFDERAYLETNADVRPVVQRGVLPSGVAHYYLHGRWEGRAYPKRRGWLGILARVLLWFEAFVRSFLARIVPWNLTSSLLGGGVYPWRPLLGPQGMQNYRAGPWRAPIPMQRDENYFVLSLKVESPVETTRWVIEALNAEGKALGEPQTLDCRTNHVTKRVLRLPSLTHSIEWRQRDAVVAWLSVLVVKPLSSATAKRMLCRRLTRPQSGNTEQLCQDGGAHTSLDALWAAYQNTFPLLGKPTYERWMQRYEGPRRKVSSQEVEAHMKGVSDAPLVSVLVPVFNTHAELLRACLDSIAEQSYPNWEACLVDDASTDTGVRKLLTEYAKSDPRFRTHFRKQNGHICRSSQDALEMAKGEFVAFVDHDDTLARDALLLLVDAVLKHPNAVLAYSDEDKLDDQGKRCDPHFKPDFDPDRLLGHNYISHLTLARRSEVVACGGFRTGYEGSQDYDLVLRLVARSTPEQIVHVPEVLYHWRKHAASTAASPEAKPYTLEAGRKAVSSFLETQRAGAQVQLDLKAQCLRVRWALPRVPPRVSLIVVADHAAERCLNSLLERTDYPDYEVLVVDDGEQSERTKGYLEHASSHERLSVVRYAGEKSASAMKNFGARKATGAVFGFIDSRIQATNDDWLKEMVCNAIRPDVGCVGAKLVNRRGLIYSAGLVLGMRGLVGHAFRGTPSDSGGYFAKLRITHTVSAVSGALVIDRRLFEQLGHFDEEHLPDVWSDVDLCLRAEKAGRRTVLTPHAELVYHEPVSGDSGSTGSEATGAVEKFIEQRWGGRLSTDPYYNPNLSLNHEDFRLRESN